MTQELDRIHLGEFRHKTPGGQWIVPHAGQSIWVYPYGRTVDDSARLKGSAALLGAGGKVADEALTELCGYIASEVVKWDIRNYRTGEEYGPPTAAVVRSLPDPLVAFLINRLLGAETEGEGPAASGGSPGGSSETEVAPTHQS